MYIVDLTFESYGSHRIYVPLKLSGHTETDGSFELFNNVPLWNALPTIKLITIVKIHVYGSNSVLTLE